MRSRQRARAKRLRDHGEGLRAKAVDAGADDLAVCHFEPMDLVEAFDAIERAEAGDHGLTLVIDELPPRVFPEAESWHHHVRVLERRQLDATDELAADV